MQLPVPPALLEISSLNRLMAITSRIVGRGLSHESQEAASTRWRGWQTAANSLGLQSQHLAVALSAQSKALMIFMHMAARYGSGRVTFKVRPCPTGTRIEGLACNDMRSACPMCCHKGTRSSVPATLHSMSCKSPRRMLHAALPLHSSNVRLMEQVARSFIMACRCLSHTHSLTA